MKKLKLKEFAITAQELLTREQLKTIVGGYFGGGNSSGCSGGCSQSVSTPGGTKYVSGSCTGDFCTCNLYGTVHSNTCKKG